ncbi:MAG: acetylxylan esterase [Acidobacteria bacterium]|nr:acetylxylan esterase [Acidobacteriota bacterium]
MLAGHRSKILETLHVPQPLPPVAAERHGAFSPEPGMVAERISYRTQLNMRVPAILYKPAQPASPSPALIIVNGHGGDKYAWYAMYAGVAYARLGFVVLTYDPAGEGERNSQRRSGTRAHDRIVPPEENGRWLGGLMITDLMQAVSYLCSLPDVDRSRIAAAGYSMGSFVVALTGAVETRLRASILTGGGNLDGPGEYWDNSKPMCQGIPYRSLAFLGDRAAVLYALHADRGRTLIYNGREDTVVAIPTHGEEFFADLKRRVIALRNGDAANVFEAGFVPGVSHRPFIVTKPVALWLSQAVGLGSALTGQIYKLPQTRIAGWAIDNGVPLDPLYATYDREYLSTFGVAQKVLQAVGSAKSLQKVLVVAWRDHAPRCVRIARRLGFDAFVPPQALPNDYDPASGQAWTRSRHAYIVHDGLSRLEAYRADVIGTSSPSSQLE